MRGSDVAETPPQQQEMKKPKQNKPKAVVSTSPFASANSNPAKAIAAKRK